MPRKKASTSKPKHSAAPVAPDPDGILTEEQEGEGVEDPELVDAEDLEEDDLGETIPADGISEEEREALLEEELNDAPTVRGGPDADDPEEDPTDVSRTDPDVPDELPEPEQTLDELYAEATAFRIKGRGKMSPAELKAAVLEAREGRGELDDLEPEEQEPPRPGEQISQDDARRIIQAKTEDLEMVVQDPGLPGFIRVFIEGEISKRKALQKQVQEKQALKTEMERFRVTKGGRYVTKEGFPTELAVGSLVMPTTHDLRHVAAQGIEFEACGEPSVSYDELGRQFSKV